MEEDSFFFLGLPRTAPRLFANDQRLDRNGHHLGSRTGDDVGGGREAGPHVRWRILDLNLHLEIHRLGAAADAETIVAHDRAGADFGDQSGERLVRIGIDGDIGALADLDVGNIGLVDLHHGLNHAHIGNGEQLSPGIVHGSDDGDFALLDRKRGDDAIHRRDHRGLGERVTGGGDVGPGLIDSTLGGRHTRLRRIEKGPRALELSERNDLRVVVRLCALVVALGLRQIGARNVAIGEERLQRSGGTLSGRGQLLLIDLQQERALLHGVSLADGEVDDLSHHVRREIDLALGIDTPVRGDFAGEIHPLDLGHRHRGDVFSAPRHESGSHQTRDHQDGHAEDDLRSSLHDALIRRIVGYYSHWIGARAFAR